MGLLQIAVGVLAFCVLPPPGQKDDQHRTARIPGRTLLVRSRLHLARREKLYSATRGDADLATCSRHMSSVLSGL